MSLNFNIHSINTFEDGSGGGEVKNQNKTITENGVYTADSGYTGLGRVSVNVETTEPTLASLTVTPSKTAQTITPPSGTDGYNTVSVNAVTASVDSDIVAENIKKDVEILGVTGTYEGITPSGTITITSNGTTDVTNYASAEVNVSGGGGSQEVRGSWVVPQCVLDLEEAFENYTAIGTYPFVYGVLLYKGIDSIEITVEPRTRLLTSEGLDIDTPGNQTDITITFADKEADNWIIFQTNSSFWDMSTVRPYGITTTALRRACFRYVIMEDINKLGYVVPNSIFLEFALESVKVKNISLGSTFNGDNLRSTSCQYMPPITNWSSNATGSNFVTKFTEAHKLPNLPYGLDLSSITSDLTLGTSNPGANRIREAYIKLPNANFTIYSSSGIIFTKDNWQYIADNAPTVSGKKLTMGNMNIAICGGATGTIIPTLTSKGWTVN